VQRVVQYVNDKMQSSVVNSLENRHPAVVNFMTKRPLRTAICITVLALLAGCGNSGSYGGTAPGPGPAQGTSFTTNFTGAETTISEGGAWQHRGLDWTAVTKVNGFVHWTQTGSAPNGGYDDSYA